MGKRRPTVGLRIPEARVSRVRCAASVLGDHARDHIFEGLIEGSQALKRILDNCCLPQSHLAMLLAPDIVQSQLQARDDRVQQGEGGWGGRDLDLENCISEA